MIDVFQPVAPACLVEARADQRRPIAVVGAGAIVDGAHLPAYRRGRLQVVGITDIDRDRARAVAARLEAIYRSMRSGRAEEPVQPLTPAAGATPAPGRPSGTVPVHGIAAGAVRP
jgi:hypothetical protein